MTRKIFNSILKVVVLAILLVLGFYTLIFYKTIDKRIMKDLGSELNVISKNYEKYGTEYLKNSSNKRITLIDPKGNIIFDSSGKNDYDNHLEREEIRHALENKDGVSRRYSNTVYEDLYYYALLQKDGNILRISQSRSTIFSVIASSIRMMALVALIIIMVSLYISNRISKEILKPIENMDLEKPLETSEFPELAPFVKKIEKQKRIIANQVEATKKLKNEFQVILSNMKEGLVLINKDMEIVLSNEFGEEILGITDSSKPIYEENRNRELMEEIKKTLSGEDVHHYLNYGKDVYNVYMSPVTEDGEVLGVALFIADETEKYNTEKIRREFLENISHEVKTPLTSILGASELLSLGLVKDEDREGMYQKIQLAASRLEDLFENLFNISRLDGSRENLEEFTLVDTKELIQGVIDNYEDLRIQKSINLTYNLEDIEIYTGRNILESVVSNLYENAIKYNKDYGDIYINTTAKDGYFLFTIEDTGQGMNKETRDRAFERFYRGDKSRSDDIEGSGLGLSIVKHGMKFLGGSIKLESVKDQGTKFEFSLKM